MAGSAISETLSSMSRPNDPQLVSISDINLHSSSVSTFYTMTIRVPFEWACTLSLVTLALTGR